MPSLIREESILVGIKGHSGLGQEWNWSLPGNEASFSSHYISGKVLVEMG